MYMRERDLDSWTFVSIVYTFIYERESNKDRGKERKLDGKEIKTVDLSRKEEPILNNKAAWHSNNVIHCNRQLYI